MMKRHIEATIRLMNRLNDLKEKYEALANRNKNDRTYFQHVKEDTKDVYQNLDEWEALFLDWADEKKRRHFKTADYIDKTNDGSAHLVQLL